jgi:glucan phosphorylase
MQLTGSELVVPLAARWEQLSPPSQQSAQRYFFRVSTSLLPDPLQRRWQVPVQVVRDGQPVIVKIGTRSGYLRAKVWRMKVGRCDLFLLDSNVEGNAPEDRKLTSRLYGGDGRIRIRQELLLGVGGFRALKEMGIGTP